MSGWEGPYTATVGEDLHLIEQLEHDGLLGSVTPFAESASVISVSVAVGRAGVEARLLAERLMDAVRVALVAEGLVPGGLVVAPDVVGVGLSEAIEHARAGTDE